MALSPVRKQYLRIKQQYPDAILLFRYGDFYEAFDDDASILSKELEIALTSREMGKGNRVPMAGIPHHALQHYLSRLVKKGYKVAICEQLSPSTKGLMEREVVRVVTPGTVFEPDLLEGKSSNYLASLIILDKEAGLAYADITTSELFCSQLPSHLARLEMERISPAELLGTKEISIPFQQISEIEFPNQDEASSVLKNYFDVGSLEELGLEHLPLAVRACAAIILYLERTQKGAVRLSKPIIYSPSSFMILDQNTMRNLEILQSMSGGPTLLSVLDFTSTSMGGRLLKRWLTQPLLDINQINRRLDWVEFFLRNGIVRAKLIQLLKKIPDLERIFNRVQARIASPRELVLLGQGLGVISQVKGILSSAGAGFDLTSCLKECPDLVELIDKAISEEGGIRQGFSPELDELKLKERQAKDYLANLEREERERWGIKSLKVGYSQVFGYYIEVTKPNLHLVPPHYIRKQTLTGAERFITPELKEKEAFILHAREQIEELEKAIFSQICQEVSGYREQILSSARAIANLDVFASLAEAAARNNYKRPIVTEEEGIVIKKGRHPVVEKSIVDGFVPNDTFLSQNSDQLVILTGPNMSGKSTYLRQVALIVLMAQIGSFVPAEEARIGIVDRIFTRLGLRDDISLGRSTFMVEMVETAEILKNATPRSLIILDEIGRGTSTYDGISIAWAVAEYIHNHPQLKAKTLFATHYHELAEICRYLPRARLYKMAATEENGRVVFLYQVVKGSADKSYGIHVAQLAGLPQPVIRRAQEILRGLEERGKMKMVRRQIPPQQLSLFSQRPQIIEEILKLDLDSLSPLEALTILYQLKKKAIELDKTQGPM